MNYSEYVDYVASRVAQERDSSVRTLHDIGRKKNYLDVAFNAIMECQAFFNKFTLNEGNHNDYDPSSKSAVNAYQEQLRREIAQKIAEGINMACEYSNEEFASRTSRKSLARGERISDFTFAKMAVQYCSGTIFERRCAKCGAKYNVIIKPATYCIETQESPSTCSAKKKPPLQIIIDQIQQQPPSTCTTGHQLLQLQAFAQRLGMHDAADVIDKIIENAKRKP